MFAEEMPSQFGDGLDVAAFGGVGCTDETISRVANIVSGNGRVLQHEVTVCIAPRKSFDILALYKSDYYYYYYG